MVEPEEQVDGGREEQEAADNLNAALVEAPQDVEGAIRDQNQEREEQNGKISF